MSQKYEKLKTLLHELFQLDQPDLDFGLYRVMHAKSAEVSQFLDKDLLPQVQAAFGQYRTADKAEIEKALAKAIEQAQSLGADPETLPKVKDLRARIKNDAVDIGALESEVYDHLYSFFRRYYSEGDFLAKRVYKPGVYAIPYEGEEVTLHWANKDQYYIKTSEYLRDYCFRLEGSSSVQFSGFSVQTENRTLKTENCRRVHFRLVDAVEGEHGNVKAAEGKDRVFILAAAGDSGRDFIAEEDGEQGKELVIRFEYRPATVIDWPDDTREGKTKPPVQKDLIALAVKRVQALADASLAAWIADLGRSHVTTSGERADYTRLEAHLKRYTARNTFDYFIHKDLGGFLRRELDFYIKNEVMHLDDVENETVPRVEQYLSKVKVIRRIAGKIIDFLAQLENFQKKLWLKKKFVVETQYCVTLGCIPEAFYAEIAANEAQHEEWVKLFAIDEIRGDMVTPGYSKPLRPEFLKAHPTLVVDTRHFGTAFTARLLEALGDIEEQTDGLLLHSENLQALRELSVSLKGRVQCLCIDPPYNTGDDGFAYRDQYRHSSWVSMMSNRFEAGRALLSETGAVFVSVDDNEVKRLWFVMDEVFGSSNYLSSMVWKRRSASGMTSQPLSLDHEYLLVYARQIDEVRLHGLARKEDDYAHFDEKLKLRYASTDLTIGATREQRPNQFYEIANPRSGVLYAANPNRVWRFFPETMKQVISNDLVIWPDEAPGNLDRPRFKTYFNPDSGKSKPCSTWIETASTNDREIEHDETEHCLAILQSGMNQEGGRVVERIFGRRAFAYPKPLSLVRSLIRAATRNDDLVLDYFAGSGTTGHAVINLNREDGGQRKFILVEMGDYFDTVLLPRIKKVTFTPEWKDGKPKRLATPEEAERSPRIVKVLRLESYEDTLNNLETRRTPMQQLVLDSAEAQGAGGLKEQYVLRYLLNVETRGSQSLLNVQAFSDPAAYRLKVKRPGSDESREVNVDLLETFNWLIGLTVQHIAAPQSFSATFERDSEGRLRLTGRLRRGSASFQCSVFSVQEEGQLQTEPLNTEPLKTENYYTFRTVTGTTPDGRRTLIIWRKLTGEPEQDNLVLDEWFTKQGYSAKDSEFDLIYVNGGNNLENLKTPDDLWKVRLIEEDFHRLMFEADGV
ncbi:site-specific DNA-methyltransferase [Accumulibacter sp.]|uniref:site-specific DNA-methyltransferase n=1 Tax=Accumulibacter sp. TaxID=2053492 RepID=UPI0035ADC06D